jgi:hypothetical protein
MRSCIGMMLLLLALAALGARAQDAPADAGSSPVLQGKCVKGVMDASMQPLDLLLARQLQLLAVARNCTTCWCMLLQAPS